MSEKAPKLETITVTHALTVRQPFAEQIRRGDKDAEFRSWLLPEKHRNKWIAIHAAAKPEPDIELSYEDGRAYPPTRELPCSVIVAYVRFVDCEKLDDGGYAWIIGEKLFQANYEDFDGKIKGGLGFWKLPELIEIPYDPKELADA